MIIVHVISCGKNNINGLENFNFSSGVIKASTGPFVCESDSHLPAFFYTTFLISDSSKAEFWVVVAFHSSDVQFKIRSISPNGCRSVPTFWTSKLYKTFFKRPAIHLFPLLQLARSVTTKYMLKLKELLP